MVQSVELLFDAETEAALRAQWTQLHAAGYPAPGPDSPPDNRPHVTVGVAAAIPAELESQLAACAALVPFATYVGATAVFSGREHLRTDRRRDILVRTVLATPALATVHAHVSAILSGCAGVPAYLLPGQWQPHVTLARRVVPAQTAAARALIDDTVLRGRFVALRRWDGERKRAWLLRAP